MVPDQIVDTEPDLGRRSGQKARLGKVMTGTVRNLVCGAGLAITL